ncbi:MAG: hypothetical protein ACO26G_00620 [Rickettsiales bacterium]
MLKFLLKKRGLEEAKEKNSIKNRAIETGNGITQLFQNILVKIKEEFEIIKEKSKNLLQTNLELGLKHLSEGNLSDARFRFAIMIRFWPKFSESYYQKAYIELLQNQPLKALKTLEKFFRLKTDNIDPKFFELKLQIEDLIKNQTNEQK